MNRFKQNFKVISITLLLLASFLTANLPTQPVFAQFDPSGQICQGSGGTNCTANGNTAVYKLIDQGTSLLLFIVGLGAVVMIIYGAFLYVSSGGDAAAVGKAKNAIIFSIIGVVIAFSAKAISLFVLSTIGKAK